MKTGLKRANGMYSLQTSYMLLLAAIVIFSAGSSYAGSFVITQAQFSANITNRLAVLEDPTRSLRAADFLDAKVRNQLLSPHNDVIRFGFTRSIIWAAVTLSNQQAVDQSVIIFNDNTNMEKIDLYLLGTHQVKRIGQSGSGYQKPATRGHINPFFELTLNPDQSLKLLIRFETRNHFHTSILTADPVSYAEHKKNIYLWAGLGIGLVIMLLCHSLFLARNFRSKNYLLFSFYALSVLFFMLTERGIIGIQWLAFQGYHTELIAAAIITMILTGCQFERHFLQLPKLHPYLNAAFKLIAAIAFLSIVLLAFIDSSSGLLWAQVLTVITMPLMIGALLIRWFNGFKPARFYLISRLLLLIATFFVLVSFFAEIPLNVALDSVLFYGLAFDALLISFAIAEHTKTERYQQQALRHQQQVDAAITANRSAFMAQLSHEIRTPMNGILGLAELLLASSVSVKQKNHLRSIATSGQQLAKIVDDVSDLAQLEADKLILEDTAFELNKVVDECLTFFRFMEQEDQLDIALQVECALANRYQGDPLRVRQILTSFIAHICHQSDQKNLAINIHPDTATIGNICFHIQSLVSKDSQHTHGALRDTDATIPDSTPASLGMKTAERLIKLMQGNFAIKNRPDGTCQAWFSIPLKKLAADADSAAESTEAFANINLLIVDDNASCRLVMQQQAAHWGIAPLIASNGKQALALLHSQANLKTPVDVIFLDHDMPGITGLDLAMKIQEDPFLKDKPLIIMLTGLGIKPNPEAIKAAAIEQVLTKPVSGLSLQSALNNLLKAHPQLATTPAPMTLADSTRASPRQEPTRLLLVTPEATSQQVITGMLKQMGIDFDLAEDGKSALSNLSQRQYHLVLLDTALPDMNGQAFIKRLRDWEAQQERAMLPVLALTNRDDHQQTFHSNSIQAHLEKPFELSSLRDSILRWVTKH